MFPGTHAQTTPDKAAIIMAGSGEAISYRQLDERSNRLANHWWSLGLRPGDHVALMMENHPRFFEVVWAALRSGLYFTAISRYLSAPEAAYIINDSGARSLVASAMMEDRVREMIPEAPKCTSVLVIDGASGQFEDYEATMAAHPTSPLSSQPKGEAMLYSSGTTGRPKGIKRPLSGQHMDDPEQSGLFLLQMFFMGMTADTVFLSPAPLYHAAPCLWGVGVHQLGGTLIIMEKFSETDYLQLVETHGVTHSQLVPTMFIRMLKLPADVRERFDVSSLQKVVHAAAPCPVPVKQQMIDWWGPIVEEYYAGTEGAGMTWISATDWLDHPGSVGKPIVGITHVCDDDGSELNPHESGTIYFEQPEATFEYHNDPEKTRSTQHPEHTNWSALGDVGYLNEDGFLFLTDRKAFMIISGGVNIYPQEIEDALVMHPKVADVAVFGLPDPDMGEFVQAVVQPAAGVEATTELADELREFTRDTIAHYKVPRVLDFVEELPRHPTGKLYKRLLRDEYIAAINAAEPQGT